MDNKTPIKIALNFTVSLRDFNPFIFLAAAEGVFLPLLPGEAPNTLPSFKIYYNLYPIIIILLVIQTKTRELIITRV